jgi:hypothetical protein
VKSARFLLLPTTAPSLNGRSTLPALIVWLLSVSAARSESRRVRGTAGDGLTVFTYPQMEALRPRALLWQAKILFFLATAPTPIII